MVTRSAPRDASLSPFAELLLRYRLTAGLSQRELADRSGLSERAVRDLERGATARPRHHSARAVAGALGLVGDDLARFLGAARLAGRTNAPAAPPAREASPAPAPGELVGRADHLRRLADLVTGGRHRVITVTGPGGVGKSRLVAELVTGLRRQGIRDVRTLDLSGLGEPELVGELIAEVLGCGGASRLPPVERAAAQLRTGAVTLVLDCFERLVAAAPVVAAFVRRCPGLTVVITSQRPLHVTDERLFRLEPLPVPEAVELFARRAEAAAPGFRLTAANAEAVSAICRAVDGLPLAVELAAARMRLLTPAELVTRLDRRLSLLAGGSRDLPARHRSLRATIESSLDVVTGDARRLFAWLGAFAAGGHLDDIEAVVTAVGRDEGWLLAALGDLVDTDLVRVRAHAGTSRYTLPDAMAELARERLATDPDRTGVEEAVARRYLTLVRRWSGDPAGLDRALVERDADNARAAVQHAVGRYRVRPDLLDPDTVQALSTYYTLIGRLNEGQALFTAAAEAGLVTGWLVAGQLARTRGDFAEAARLGTETLHRLDPDDHATRASVHLHLGAVAAEAGDPGYARRQMRAALSYARRSKDVALIGRALNHLGVLSAELGRLDHADRLFSAALEARRRCGADAVALGRAIHNLAEIALEAGRYPLAVDRAREAAALLPKRPAAQMATVEALALLNLGRPGPARAALARADEQSGRPDDEHRVVAFIELRRSVVLHATGERTAAAAAMTASLPGVLASTKRYLAEAAGSLEAHAGLLVPRDPATAAQVLGAAAELRRRSGRPAAAPALAQVTRAGAACRAALGDAEFDRAHRRGAHLTTTELVRVCARVGV